MPHRPRRRFSYPQADPDRLRRADDRHAALGAGPDHRVHCAADHRRRARRAGAPLLGDHGVSAGFDDLGALYGKLSDLYGRKLLFQFGIAVFVVGSFFSATAQKRGVADPVPRHPGAGRRRHHGNLAGHHRRHSVAAERGRYQGYMGGVFAFASVAGPLIGGFFTDQLTWRWVFFINIPLGIFAFVITAIVLAAPPACRPQGRLRGGGADGGAVSCLLLVMTWGGTQYAWTSMTIEALTGPRWRNWRCSVVGASFEEPAAAAAPVQMRVRVSSAIGMVLGVAMFGAIAFMPVYMQVVKGASATGSGCVMLPMMLGVVTSSTLSGRYISQTGRYRHVPHRRLRACDVRHPPACAPGRPHSLRPGVVRPSGAGGGVRHGDADHRAGGAELSSSIATWA